MYSEMKLITDTKLLQNYYQLLMKYTYIHVNTLWNLWIPIWINLTRHNILNISNEVLLLLLLK